MTTTNTTADVLRRARDLIVRDGWAKGTFGTNTTEPKCPLGAIWTATNDFDAEIAARLALAQVTGVATYDITDWNDAPERTEADVLAAFDRAIAEASK